MQDPTPYPTVSLPPMPESIQRLWWDIFNRPALYGQSPVRPPDPTPVPWPTPYTGADPSLEVVRLLARAEGMFDSALDAFSAIRAEVNLAWYINGPFDVLAHWLFGSFLGWWAYLLISGILLTVESNWGERLPFGNSASAQREWGIRLFSGLSGACVALASHLWWDGYSLLPYQVGNWLFWGMVLIGGSVTAFLLGRAAAKSRAKTKGTG